MKENIFVGYTRKPFGVNGGLKLQIENQYLEDVINTSVLFIEIGGQQVPHFIDEIRLTADVIVQFEDLHTKEKVAKLSSKAIYLSPNDLMDPADKTIPIDEANLIHPFVGYLLQDQILGVIGKIERVEEFPQQDMAIIDYQGKEIMVPLHPDLQVSEDAQNKVLVVDLPAGLLEL